MRALVLALVLSACGGPPASLLERCREACMPSATVKAVHGLNTSPNPFSHVPEGALLIADEVVTREAGVLVPRHGMKSSTSFLGDRCFPLPTTTKMLCTARGIADPTLYDPDTDTVSTVTRGSGLSSQLPAQSPYSTDPRVSMQAATARGNLYFTTSTGIGVVPGVASPPWRSAGLPPPFVSTYLGASGVGALVFATGKRRTYRATLAMYDALGNFLEGPPSEPVPLDNTTGETRSATVGTWVPAGAPPGVFCRLYRSLEVPAGTTGSDEMFLVNHSSPAVTTGADGFVTSGVFPNVADLSVDSTLTIPLYTNRQTGDGIGISGQNSPPPAAAAVAWFKGRMYYGRPTFRQGLQLQIIGTGAGGMQNGDTITIDGIGWLAGTDFTVSTGGSVAANVEATARSLCYNLNQAYRYTGLGKSIPALPINRLLRAQYISSGVSDFGRIFIERIFPAPRVDDSGIAFSATSSSPGVAWLNGTTSSTDNYAPGGVAWSKVGQPEAVPPINYQTVGDPTMAVLAFSIHRDVMFMWKEDGVWIVRDDGGAQPSFAQLDASVITVAPASIGVVDNIAYAYTTRGILQVSEQGTIPISEPVHDDVMRLIDLSPTMQAQAFGVGHDAGRSYILAAGGVQYVVRVPDPGYPPSPPEITRWRLPGLTHGMVLPVVQSSPSSGRLAFLYQTQALGSNLLGAPTRGALIERKGGVGSLDFVDYIGSIANPATTTTNKLTFASDVHLEMFPGDLFRYNPGGIGTKVYTMRVVAVDNRGNVTLDAAYPFTAGGTLTYYRGIQCHWRYAPLTLGEPTAEKLWESVQLHFDYIDGDWCSVLIDANKAQLRGYSTVATDPVVSNTSNADITKIPWLRLTHDVVLRVDPGQAEARAARLGVEVMFAQALASFRLTAMSANAEEFRKKATR